MLPSWPNELSQAVSAAIRGQFGIEHEAAFLVPPTREMGDLAFPAAMGLARELKRNPRQIAEEILDALELPDYVTEVRVEGAGYLNVYLRRDQLAVSVLEHGTGDPPPPADLDRIHKVIVEHTNINPNKAAHIGHLRNAVLGDVLVRILRRLGYPVEIQNYIDDTGVQLADVVVGFVDLDGQSLTEIEAVADPFDHVCWELYARVGRTYEEDEAQLEHRRETLHELESGEGPRADVGRLVARRVVGRHLDTMGRLGIGYDLLTHESAILGLDFFSTAFEQLRASGAIRLETSGKNEGCWVMPLASSPEFAGLEDPDKVIVRSDGTVTYVGKDIAYQLWKFGLLGKDFEYSLWEREHLWETTIDGVPDHPAFGAAQRVINVIDARQSYLQKVVQVGLQALGHEEQAKESIHFAYEMVSLSRKTARQLGFLAADGEAEDTSLEMSGRKGIGVKADDLLDQLEEKSRSEISERNPELPSDELAELAHQICTGALRFFMAKTTTTRVLVFDLDEALSFEGETGPYLQYSVVRARNIRRKLEAAGLPTATSPEALAAAGAEPWSDDLWDLVLTAASNPEIISRAGATLELSLVARHALDLAQKFNAIYHRHPILQEEDEVLRSVRLAATQIFEESMVELTDLLGIPLPQRM